MKNKNEIIGTCMVLGMLIGIICGSVFEIKLGVGIAFGMLGGIIIGSIKLNPKSMEVNKSKELRIVLPK